MNGTYFLTMKYEGNEDDLAHKIQNLYNINKKILLSSKGKALKKKEKETHLSDPFLWRLIFLKGNVSVLSHRVSRSN